MKTLNLLLDLIYPPKCILCNKILDTFSNTRYLCDECKNSYTFIEISGCVICGRETSNKLCDACSTFDSIYFDKNYSLFTYTDEFKSLIFKLKYGLNKKYAYVMSLLMYEYVIKNNLFKNIDIITSVPMHKSKQKKRGFNQSELLAKQLSKYLNIPYEQTLFRNKNTVPQSKLHFEDRFKNLKSVFTYNNKINVENKNILIIDDIYTSGATIMNCSQVLKQQNANKIYSLTFSLVFS